MLKRSQLPAPVSPLSKWCHDNDITATNFGVLIGKGHGMACRYLKAHADEKYVEPPFLTKKIIYILTDGKITPNDLVPLGEWQEELADEVAEALPHSTAAEPVVQESAA